ncbi:hypothetical protein J2S05_003116 [Alkalicoccobacillus murimartini]|uniref:CPBP family intramembrane metalloprotease n=1 Tax=Alkalicoccobacillus murimartini TaxID=171685 RepID=A0ABT9YLF4_9BACI|nr:hypothetical protein [Alkalicoccobacillus murimartini]
MDFLILFFISYTIACYFGFGATFFLVGNLKTLEQLIGIFRFPNPKTFEKKFLNSIHLCFLYVPHASYRFLEESYSFIKVKLIYGYTFYFYVSFLTFILPFLEEIGALNSIDRT